MTTIPCLLYIYLTIVRSRSCLLWRYLFSPTCVLLITECSLIVEEKNPVKLTGLAGVTHSDFSKQYLRQPIQAEK